MQCSCCDAVVCCSPPVKLCAIELLYEMPCVLHLCYSLPNECCCGALVMMCCRSGGWALQVETRQTWQAGADLSSIRAPSPTIFGRWLNQSSTTTLGCGWTMAWCVTPPSDFSTLAILALFSWTIFETTANSDLSTLTCVNLYNLRENRLSSECAHYQWLGGCRSGASDRTGLQA